MEHRRYFNSIAAEWNSLEVNSPGLKKLVKKLKLKPDASILDVGTGTGNLTEMLSQESNRPEVIIAIDSAIEMLRYARQKQYARRVFFISADAHWLPFGTLRFDHVICFGVFPHLKYPQKALHEFYRTLKISGRLTIAHLSSSDRINAIHNEIGWPVANDFLPKVKDVVPILIDIGFKLVHAEESKDLYFVQVRKD